MKSCVEWIFQIAGAMQRQFEKTTNYLISLTKQMIGQKNLIIGGGAAMNCVMNGKLDKSKLYHDTHISYAPDDSGVAIGATLLAYNRFFKQKRKVYEVKSCYYGPEFSDKEVFSILNKYKIKFFKPNNLFKFAAQEIARKKLIGWFQDRMEFGHRALGNRSILADPRSSKIKETVNKAVKYRESFRPFAPAVLSEFSYKIFDMPEQRKVYFMERAYKIRKNWIKKIPGVTHIDGTGRVQTVDKKVNIKFYKLINEFNKITKVPVLLNTSFNLNGEPIVRSPEDAIRTFFSCGLDYLIIGSYVIAK
jgi:carbamoyltransferase